MFGRCLEGVWKVSGRCLEGVRKVLEGVWKVCAMIKKALESIKNYNWTGVTRRGRVWTG